jgi:hypothetical protein
VHAAELAAPSVAAGLGEPQLTAQLPLPAVLCKSHGAGEVQVLSATRNRLVVQPIYQQSDTGAAYDTVLFGNVIAHAPQFPGTIVNVSLRSSARIDAIPTEVDNNRSSSLFVVAAGNQGKVLDSEGAPNEACGPHLSDRDSQCPRKGRCGIMNP